MKDEKLILAQEVTELARERNRLAIQRTFLSWIRMGLACTITGIAIIRFLIFQDETHRLLTQSAGFILIGVGCALYLLAFFDYLHNFKQLDSKGSYAGRPLAITLVTLCFFLLSLMIFIVLMRST